MNKKIYFKDSYIHFNLIDSQYSQNQLIKRNLKNLASEDDLKKIIVDLLEGKNFSVYQTSINNFDPILAQLKKQFYYLEAAGGFIEKNNTFLFIDRLDRWDLPKGKIEPGESVEACAIRECEEECGVKDLTIVKKLRSTFHIYAYKKGFALKQTFWFHMTTDYSRELVPQVEEDIKEVKWMSHEDIKQIVKFKTYRTILDVIEFALS